jgi:NAD+ diphosphatase
LPAVSDLGPKPRLGYTQSLVDRIAERRRDEAWLREVERDPRSAAYVIGSELIVLKKAGDGYDAAFTPAEARALAPVVETVFLGVIDGAARFGIGIAQTDAEALKVRDDLFVIDLRSIAIQGLVGQDDLPPLAEAKALLHWHARHRFCSNCGAPSRVTDGGWRRDCPACKAQHFPRTDPVAIMLATRGDRALLGRSGRFASTMWSCLAGFIEPGEAIEDAVRREVLEEAGIRCGRVDYLFSQPWPFPSSLMIGCHAEALNDDIVIDRDELEAARWFSRDELAAMLLRRHPEGLTTPPPVAIAHHLIRTWVEGGMDEAGDAR